MKHSNTFIVILSSFLILPPCLVSAADSFNKVYVFGDSLSDTGNLAAVPGFEFLNQPPFDGGFSNGPRAVEVLAERLGLSTEPSLFLVGLNTGTNFAVAGARARGDETIDLNSQLTAFLFGVGSMAPANALYVLFIGGNDVRDARDEKNQAKATRILRSAASSIDNAIRTLLVSGAKSILVINSPDIGATPETIALAQNPGAGNIVRSARLKTEFFNDQLSQRLLKIEKDFDLDLVDFDLFSFSHSVIDNSSALGFINTTEGCFSSETFTFTLDCENGLNFDNFVYFDEIHTSARANERIGQAFFSLVPEPTETLDLTQ